MTTMMPNRYRSSDSAVAAQARTSTRKHKLKLSTVYVRLCLATGMDSLVMLLG